MRREHVIYLLASLWLFAYAGSFAAFSFTEPTGDSFVRGLNRVGVWLGWQAAAGALGLFAGYCTFTRRRELSRWVNILGFTPLTISGLTVAVVAFVVINAIYFSSWIK